MLVAFRVQRVVLVVQRSLREPKNVAEDDWRHAAAAPVSQTAATVFSTAFQLRTRLKMDYTPRCHVYDVSNFYTAHGG